MLTLKEIFRKEIDSIFSFPFNAPESGLYSLTIRASVKPGWRNVFWDKFKGLLTDIFDLHLNDEDLRIEIDGLKFEKPNGKRGLFNGPAAFSGTQVLGKTKTVIFLIKLTQGDHTVSFIPQRTAFLESLAVEKISDGKRIEFYTEAVAENENYYSWYTFALVEQTLKSFSINAQAGVSIPGKDDDDLKIVIDGKVRKNLLSSHKDSYFCGFSLKGKEHSYMEDPNLKIGTHYIELFADKTPILHSVKFTLVPPVFEAPKADIRIYRPGPKGEDYNRFDDLVNEMVNLWNDKFLTESDPPPRLWIQISSKL